MKTNWDDLMENPNESEYHDEDVSNVRVIPASKRPLEQDFPPESRRSPLARAIEEVVGVAEPAPPAPVEEDDEAMLERRRDLMRKLHPSNQTLTPAQKVKLEATGQAIRHASTALDELEIALDWVHVFDPVSDWEPLVRELTKLVSTLEYRKSVT